MEVANAIGCAFEQTFRSAAYEAESTVPFASLLLRERIMAMSTRIYIWKLCGK